MLKPMKTYTQAQIRLYLADVAERVRKHFIKIGLRP